MDVDNIDPGLDFVKVLNEQVTQCDVLISVIGRGWIDALDETGVRRLDNPADFVRIEIESALAQDKRVIPVLVGQALMPRVDQLPEAMKPLDAQCGQINARAVSIRRPGSDRGTATRFEKRRSRARGRGGSGTAESRGAACRPASKPASKLQLWLLLGIPCPIYCPNACVTRSIAFAPLGSEGSSSEYSLKSASAFCSSCFCSHAIPRS
jgi:hypothetical protein